MPVDTNPSIFLRLNAADAQPRELAWDEFADRYEPIISGFARRLGSKPADIDDIVQDVLLGFFMKSPSFVYDSTKGRFRGYLKVCTYHALQKRFKQNSIALSKPFDELDPDAIAVEEVWNDVWEQEILRRAVEQIRRETGDTRSFAAFERCAVLDQSPDVVAHDLGLHVETVYRARNQITRLLKARLTALRDED